AARGTGTSGDALAMQLSNDQSADNTLSEQGTHAAADAYTRGLNALMGSNQIGGQLWGEGAQKANAADIINRYNTEATNQSKYYNAQLPWQTFQGQLQRAGGLAGTTPGYAQGQVAAGQRARDYRAGMWGGAADLARGAINYYNQPGQPPA